MMPTNVIKTGAEVTNIDWSGPGVIVSTNTGQLGAGFIFDVNFLVFRELQL